MNFDLKSNVGIGSFRTEEMGMHEVLVRNEGEAVRGAPHFLRSMPMSKKDYDGLSNIIKNLTSVITTIRSFQVLSLARWVQLSKS